MPQKQIEIVCHKGANEYAPENTFAAAQLCIDWGMDYVEIDVNASKDGVLYILHGPDLDKTTNGKGRITDLTSEEIDQLDAGSWFHPKFAGERVPRLEPFLRWIKGKAKVFLDVKAGTPQQLIDLIYDVGLENDCFFWSGNDEWMLKLRALDDKLQLKVNVKSVADVVEAAELVERDGCDGHHAPPGFINIVASPRRKPAPSASGPEPYHGTRARVDTRRRSRAPKPRLVKQEVPKPRGAARWPATVK